MNRAALLLGLVVVVLLGVWPWYPLIDLFPHGSDATKWVQYSHPTTPTWAEYVFATRHFIGYRPVTALTFTLNGLISGWHPWAYRLTDIALHGVVGVLLYATCRALTRSDGRAPSAFGLLAPLVFFLHPAVEDVVPHLARRSYSLSCALALAGLLAFVGVARDPDRPWQPRTWLATALLALALLANEVAGVVVAMLPILALHLRPADARGPWWGALRPAIPTFAATLGVLGLRWAILGNLTGGYHKRYFAFTDGERALLAEVGDWPQLRIFAAAWRYAAFPSSAFGRESILLETWPAIAVAVGIGLAYLWIAVVQPARGWRDPEARLPGVLIVWLLGYAVLYALTRNWFWRQGYPMLLPLGLLVAVLAERTWQVPDRRWRLLASLPHAALLLSIAWHSPVVHGLDRRGLSIAFRTTAIIDALAERTRGLEEPALVWLVVPSREGNAHMARIWTDHLLGRDRVSYRLLAVTGPTRTVSKTADLLRVRDRDGHPVLALADGMVWADAPRNDFEIEGMGEIALERLHRRGTNTWVFGQTADGWDLIPVPPP